MVGPSPLACASASLRAWIRSSPNVLTERSSVWALGTDTLRLALSPESLLTFRTSVEVSDPYA